MKIAHKKMNDMIYFIYGKAGVNKITLVCWLLSEKIPTDLTKNQVAGGAIELLVISPGYQECPKKITFCSMAGGGIKLLVKKQRINFGMNQNFTFCSMAGGGMKLLVKNERMDFVMSQDFTFCSMAGRGMKPKVISKAHFSSLQFNTAQFTKGLHPTENIILLVIIMAHFSPSFIKGRTLML